MFNSNGADHPNRESYRTTFRNSIREFQRMLTASLTRPNGRKAGESQERPSVAPQPGNKIDLKLLLICAQADDPTASAICNLMEHLGVPFDVLEAKKEQLTASRLSCDAHAYYQGILVTTPKLAYWDAEQESWECLLDQSQEAVINEFLARFDLRQVILSSVPDGSAREYGLELAESAGFASGAVGINLTRAGESIFWYLNPETAIPVQFVAAYPAQVSVSACERVTSLLITRGGDTMAATYRHPMGGEHLILTFAQSPAALHTKLLGYGLINWVCKGLFVGRRRVYLSVQVDDIFNQNLLWDVKTTSSSSGETYRLSAQDAQALVEWLEAFQSNRNAAEVTLDLAFNGASIAPSPTEDALAATLLRHQARFRWLNHGYAHTPLDAADYATSYAEIADNQAVAEQLGLGRYSPNCMVTGGMSGLRNPNFLAAATKLGIRYLVSDTSRPGEDNPSPNCGIQSPHAPSIWIIPRHPNSLFFNVSTPEEWVSQYNHHYSEVWGHELSLEEIIDAEAVLLLNYMLNFDVDPWMFHQANLRAYDGQNSLLSKLLDKVMELYNRYYGDVPVVSLGMYEIGQLMVMRAACNQAEIRATLTAGQWLEISADREVVVPVTGAAVPGKCEQYAGQRISLLHLQPGVVTQIPMHNLIGHQVDANERPHLAPGMN